MDAGQVIPWVAAAVGGVAIFGAGWLVASWMSRQRAEGAVATARRMVEEARRECETIKRTAELEAKEAWLREKENFERETRQAKVNVQRAESRLSDRERKLDRKVDLLTSKEIKLDERGHEFEERSKALAAREVQVEKLIAEETSRLERIGNLSADEARVELMHRFEHDAREDAQHLVREIREEALAEGHRQARDVVINAISRCAVEHATVSTVSVVQLPTEEMKGRIIGREGRNIRAFEMLTGVDVIVDDTPEAVLLSSFDPIRREVAKLALENLVDDGRIHPGRIEEIFAKVQQDVEERIHETGRQTAVDVGISDMHPKLLYYVGRLHFRTSFGQNALLHSKEVAWLNGLIAAELGLDAALARRAGLLHDIGKSTDHEVEGTHTEIGVELARRYGENPIVVNAIAALHEDEEPTHPIAILTQTADAISGARPGARRDTLESYVKRLQRLEAVANSFDGVAKSYAIQAGREIRVIVDCDSVDDMGTETLADDVADSIQAELEYPGQIKVTVIREHRTVRYAR
jgi:ribonuclease Y